MSETRTVTLYLPHPPATNNLYFTQIIFPKYGKRKPYPLRVLSPEAKDYKARVAEVAADMFDAPIVGEVWVTFRWFRPRRIGDLDGIFKVILDALKGYAFHDDGQVARIYADRFEDKDHPRVELVIQPLGLC